MSGVYPILTDLLTALHVIFAIMVSVHVLLHKRDVGSAIGWMGLAWLSPFIGSVSAIVLPAVVIFTVDWRLGFMAVLIGAVAFLVQSRFSAPLAAIADHPTIWVNTDIVNIAIVHNIVGIAQGLSFGGHGIGNSGEQFGYRRNIAHTVSVRRTMVLLLLLLVLLLIGLFGFTFTT